MQKTDSFYCWFRRHFIFQDT